MTKPLKGDWFIVFYLQLWQIMLYLFLKNINTSVLKRKVDLNTKFGCMCVTMCTLVTSPFSRDCFKQKQLG